MSERNVLVRDGLTGSEIDQVLALVHDASDADGVAPLSEAALLRLKHGAPAVLTGEPPNITGYALFCTPAAEPEQAPLSAELVVHPDHRHRGHGRALAETLLAQTGNPVRFWAHGDLPAAAVLAGRLGLTRARVLLKLARPLRDAPLPPVELPAGLRIRTFVPGTDERDWLRVNARAFAHHPEQGGWTGADLLDREAEPWFDPNGFFLAERAGRLVGFHWTKVHGADELPSAIGEVYVVGVDPAEQGSGLGRALTLIGLHHLRDRGLPEVILYADQENRAAVRLYESLGFREAAVDVMYASEPVRNP